MKDYNFFEDYQTKRGISIDIKSPLFIAALVLLICVAASIGLVGRNLIMTSQIGSINEEIQTLQASQKYIKASQLELSVNSMVQYDQSAQGVMQTFLSSSVIGTEFMKTLAHKLPATVTMTTFTLDNASANFTFNVPNRKAAAELLLSLKDSGLFQYVELSTVFTDDTNNSTAGITAILKAGEVK